MLLLLAPIAAQPRCWIPRRKKAARENAGRFTCKEYCLSIITSYSDEQIHPEYSGLRHISRPDYVGWQSAAATKPSSGTTGPKPHNGASPHAKPRKSNRYWSMRSNGHPWRKGQRPLMRKPTSSSLSRQSRHQLTLSDNLFKMRHQTRLIQIIVTISQHR